VLLWIPLIDLLCHVGSQPCAVSGSIPEVAISFFTMTTLPKSFLRNECQALHVQWISSLKELKAVTHPESRTMLIEHLRDLYSRATTLLDSHGEQLDTISSSLLHHINSSSLDGHIAIAKNTENLLRSY
jgi:hypothetical protein